MLNRLEQLGEVRREFDTQNLIREGLAAAAREELINRYEEAASCPCASDEQRELLLEKLGEIRAIGGKWQKK